MANPNPYEELARNRKAIAIAAFLHRHRFQPAAARDFDDSQRDMAARGAGQKHPSTKSWDLVVELLEDLGTPDDPFDGLV